MTVVKKIPIGGMLFFDGRSISVEASAELVDGNRYCFQVCLWPPSKLIEELIASGEMEVIDNDVRAYWSTAETFADKVIAHAGQT